MISQWSPLASIIIPSKLGTTWRFNLHSTIAPFQLELHSCRTMGLLHIGQERTPNRKSSLRSTRDFRFSTSTDVLIFTLASSFDCISSHRHSTLRISLT